MTQQEYKKEYKRLDDDIFDLRRKQEELRKSFLTEHALFKQGDKVCIIWDAYKHPYQDGKIIPEKRIEAYIGGIHDKYYSGMVNYTFLKVKKDGSCSSQSAGIYGTSYSRIELIESAKS